MNDETTYGIGAPGKVWGKKEKDIWFEKQYIKRSYRDEVLVKVIPLEKKFDLVQYGALALDKKRYPLYAIKTKSWQVSKKTILVTGGVHGYETSGVQGAIRFTETQAQQYEAFFNIIVIPCVSPWGYETINRWNAQAIDPNRSFYQDSPAQESASLMTFIKSIDSEIYLHIDLHETTDTDNSEFRPALAARDAIVQRNWNIPDGFYSVGDSTKPEAEFQQAVIKGVEKITHIAPADDENRLIGEKIEQFGVINYAARELGLCMGLTDATYVTTTEVYPDSPKVNDENCILAQVAAITSAIDYAKTN
jgi:hypothetical protein